MIRDMHSAQAKAGMAIMALVGSAFAAPILAASPAVASITSVLSNPLVQQGAFNMTVNAGSQYMANGGDVGDINMIEVGTAGIPGTNLIPVVAGETFSLTANKFDQGVTIPNSFSKWGIQVGGGILSNRFGKATDNHMSGQGFGGAVVSEYFKLIIETGSNAAPSLAD